MRSINVFLMLSLLVVGTILTASAGGHISTDGPSALCHVTDGAFTDCGGVEEWSDITGTEFSNENGLLSVLYVDQADLRPDFQVSEEVPEDTLMLMYDEVQRTLPLGAGETVHVHFMTVDEDELLHYDVFIGTSGLEQVFINDLEQVPMPSGVDGIAGFGPSPNNAAPHVIAEFQIGLDAADIPEEECCYSPDPAFWSSGLPPGVGDEGPCPNAPNPDDCDGDGVPNQEDSCLNVPGLPENEGCPEGPECPFEPNDCDGDGLPNHEDECPDRAGPPENAGCPLPDGETSFANLDRLASVTNSTIAIATNNNIRTEVPTQESEETTTAAILTANLDGSTTSEFLDPSSFPPGTEIPLCGTIGLIVDFRVPPTGDYKNHGDYVSQVAKLTNKLVKSQVKAGIITEVEGENLHSCVVGPRAASDVGKKNK